LNVPRVSAMNQEAVLLGEHVARNGVHQHAEKLGPWPPNASVSAETRSPASSSRRVASASMPSPAASVASAPSGTSTTDESPRLHSPRSPRSTFSRAIRPKAARSCPWQCDRLSRNLERRAVRDGRSPACRARPRGRSDWSARPGPRLAPPPDRQRRLGGCADSAYQGGFHVSSSAIVARCRYDTASGVVSLPGGVRLVAPRLQCARLWPPPLLRARDVRSLGDGEREACGMQRCSRGFRRPRSDQAQPAFLGLA
jgi:hypothetical protein